MAMARRTAVRPKPPKARTGRDPQGDLDLPTADHAEVEGMFRQYERDRRHAQRLEKGKLALRICHALTVDAKIEQEEQFFARFSNRVRQEHVRRAHQPDIR
jgi:hypothetical protein